MKTVRLFSITRLLLFMSAFCMGLSTQAMPHDGEEEPSSHPFSPLTQANPQPPLTPPTEHTFHPIPVHRRLSEAWMDYQHTELDEQTENLAECSKAILHKWPGRRGQTLIDLAIEHPTQLGQGTPFSFSRLMDLLDTFCGIEQKYPNVLPQSYAQMMAFYNQGVLPHWGQRQRCLYMASYLLATSNNESLTHNLLHWFYRLTGPQDLAERCNTFFHRLYDLTKLYPESYLIYLHNLDTRYRTDSLDRKVGYLEGLRDALIHINPLSPPPPFNTEHPQPEAEPLSLQTIITDYTESHMQSHSQGSEVPCPHETAIFQPILQEFA